MNSPESQKSKDSSPSYIHFHHPRLADFFEDFNRPHTSPSGVSITGGTGANGATNNPTSSANVALNNTSTPASIPSFLPIEDIYVAPQYQPVNPEDEDDVVPDQHAAFGITRAMDDRRRVVWRDLGLEELMRGVRLSGRANPGVRTGAGARRVMCLR